jgi:hypothetical protein
MGALEKSQAYTDMMKTYIFLNKYERNSGVLQKYYLYYTAHVIAN